MLKIYLTDLAAYNNGYLVGKWVNLPLNTIELSQEIQQILIDGATACGYGDVHEEWFISDFEWDTIALHKIDEYEDIYTLNQQLLLIEDKSSAELKKIKYLLDSGITNSIENSLEHIDDVLIYENQTLEDIAYNYLNESYEVDKLPTIISSHIDYNGIAKDLEMEGIYTVVGSDVFECRS